MTVLRGSAQFAGFSVEVCPIGFVFNGERQFIARVRVCICRRKTVRVVLINTCLRGPGNRGCIICIGHSDIKHRQADCLRPVRDADEDVLGCTDMSVLRSSAQFAGIRVEVCPLWLIFNGKRQLIVRVRVCICRRKTVRRVFISACLRVPGNLRRIIRVGYSDIKHRQADYLHPV